MTKEFHAVFFSSRNKDNTMVKDFKQRVRVFVTDELPSTKVDGFCLK